MTGPMLFAVAVAGACLLAGGTLLAEEIPYGVPDKPWDAAWGNHRARVAVDAAADAVWVHLPWRRRDPSPQDKAVIVIAAATKRTVENVVRAQIGREAGDLVFQAPSAGEYHVYYMPFTIQGSYFPTTLYTKPKATAGAAWIAKHGLADADLAAGKWQQLPKAKVVAFEARTDFDRMDPMEVIATADELKKLLAGNAGRPYLLFLEDRKFPIRMTDDLPERWIRSGPGAEFHGEAMRNEFYVFQIGVYAAQTDLGELAVSFTDLRPAGGGKAVPASALRCSNTGGADWLGRPMVKQVTVPKGKVQALWIGVDLPADAAADTYEGSVAIKPAGQELATVKLTLKVLPDVLKDRGDSELWRMARLRWLDSTIGLEDEVTAPYTPLELQWNNTVVCLGRRVTFGAARLPEHIIAGTQDILAAPVDFIVTTADGRVDWTPLASPVPNPAPASITFHGGAAGGPFTLTTQAKMEFDGYINFQVSLKAAKDTDVTDCRLEIPLKSRCATYMMGMGCKGGFRPEKFSWKWDPKNHQDSLWLGDVTGGLQCKLKGPDYRWPLVNIHYHRRPLLMPDAWHNGGKGGCTVEPAAGDRVVIRAYGGPRKISAGQELRFDFALLVTPVKPLDPRAHFSARYYHSGVPAPKAVADAGAKIVNIHHANEINPFINYPFLRPDAMSAYVKSAHELGLKVKLYYTIRELTNHTVEIWPLRSLGNEIYADGPGGGYAWLHEHLVDHYSPAWHHPFGDGTWCASISQTGLSRWHNYYLEGLNWLCRNMEIDGLYLDEIGYDREIMKRVRRVLDKARPGSLLDLHSWNHLNGQAGFANCLNLYMEHMPYLDSLWIGEGRNYDEGPDHYMVEISGIPFGLFSEMLEHGGNPWRGMLYGMTNRLPWSGNPKPLWKLWDDFGIADSEMLGYWAPDCPVKTGQKDVLATVYRKKGKAALVVIASWAKDPVECALQIDWQALGLEAGKAKLYAPEIQNLQTEDLLDPAAPLPVQPRGGWMLILDQTPRKTASQAAEDVYANRKLLMEEKFAGASLADAWKTSVSSRPGTRISVADGALVVDCTANSCAFADRPLPPGATLVECQLNSGNDGGQTWGLGLALVWPKAFVRIHLRAEDRRFGYDDGHQVLFGPAAQPGTWQHVRIRLEADKVCLEGAAEAKSLRWRTIATFDRKQFPGDPAAVRIGKMNDKGQNADHGAPGGTGTCRVRELRVFGSR
ncbi:MAG: DUF6067 family protein [Planctomycetota bacterium]|nr:DUF6067 family protein [Planctomycetota bacterium]